MNNAARDPRFVKDLPAENLLLVDDDCPVSETIVETLLFAGFNPDMPIYTLDGDRVRLIAVDPDHQFPLVGEVIDFGAEATWLARWSASGVYASSSSDARRKHSLHPNEEPGHRVMEPIGNCDVVDPDFFNLLYLDEARDLFDRFTSHGVGAIKVRFYEPSVPDTAPITEGRRPDADAPIANAVDFEVPAFLKKEPPVSHEEDTFHALHPTPQDRSYAAAAFLKEWQRFPAKDARAKVVYVRRHAKID